MIVTLPLGLYDDAIALWHACGLTRPWNDPLLDLTRAVQGPSSTVLASVVGGALRGTVMVGLDGHRAWVYYLAVSPESQCSGVGRALMAAAEAWARDRGYPKLMLMVRSGNDAVLGFYAALGYEVDEVSTLGKRL